MGRTDREVKLDMFRTGETRGTHCLGDCKDWTEYAAD